MKWNEQLRQERKSRGWAQGRVAKEIGTTIDTVNRWERGKTFPSSFYQQQLSQLFGKSLEELGLFSFFSEGESNRSKQSDFITSKEEHVYNNQSVNKDIELLEECYTVTDDKEERVHNNQSVNKDTELLERCYTVTDNIDIQSQVSVAPQEPDSSLVNYVQADEPNPEILTDHRLLDQPPFWELHIQMRGLSPLRSFPRLPSRSLLILPTILFTILITVALLLAFNRQPLPTSPSSSRQESINDVTQGTDFNQFNYVGSGWEHRASVQSSTCGYTSILNNSTVSSDKTANDYVTITFTGVQIDFYGMLAPSYGIGAVSIDGSSETMIDFYAANPESNQLLWTSPKLSAGTHTFKLRVTGDKNPRSFAAFVAINHVNIIHYVL